MWFIAYKQDENEEKIVNKIFKQKTEAFKHIKESLNNVKKDNVFILSINTETVDEKISTDNALYINEKSSSYKYGVISGVTPFLVIVKKDNGSIVELTKARINTEIIKGNMYLTN